MDTETLSNFLETPAAHSLILAGYQGAYSLGVGEDPSWGHAPVLILHIEGRQPNSFPDKIDLDGETVPVIVKTGFVAPQPLALTP